MGSLFVVVVCWVCRACPSVYENCPLSAKIGLYFANEQIMTCERLTLPEKHSTLRVVPMPADLNQNGDVFGGWVMAQVDVAGAIPAMRRARGRVATVSVNSFTFKQPVSVGDIVSLYAEIEHAGRTSITVKVEVYAERNYANPVVVKVTEAELTYVAIDSAGKKRMLPPENMQEME
jgi:acyl-CoA thioesterase YciA